MFDIVGVAVSTNLLIEGDNTLPYTHMYYLFFIRKFAPQSTLKTF